MEIYVLKSALCLLAFYVFYKGILESSSLHRFKRVYLILALALSFGIPLITFTTYIESTQGAATTLTTLEEITITEERSFNYLSTILWSIYGLGLLLFGIRFLKNLATMIGKIVRNPKERSHRIIKVLLSERIVPHTFFSYIFLNRRKYENNEIPEEVLAHEQTHARELHTADVLLAELICVLFWFNPVVHFIKRAIKLNHEFLADRSVLNQGVESVDYQKILLAYSSNAQSPQLANSINYSSLKKRFTVMKAKTSKRAIWLRTILILPLMALVLFSFTNREYIPIETEHSFQKEMLQTSASRDEMREYNKLAKKYNAMDKEDRVIKLKDLKRLEYIYQKMSPKQKKDAEPFPECIPPPPPPPAPDAPQAVNPQVPNPPPPPPPAASTLITSFDEMINKGYIFYLNGNRITDAEARKLGNDQAKLARIDVVKADNGKNFVYLETFAVKVEKSYNSGLDLIIDHAKKDAEFYYNKTRISSDEAISLIKKNPNLKVRSQTNYKNGNKSKVWITSE